MSLHLFSPLICSSVLYTILCCCQFVRVLGACPRAQPSNLTVAWRHSELRQFWGFTGQLSSVSYLAPTSFTPSSCSRWSFVILALLESSARRGSGSPWWGRPPIWPRRCWGTKATTARSTCGAPASLYTSLSQVIKGDYLSENHVRWSKTAVYQKIKYVFLSGDLWRLSIS